MLKKNVTVRGLSIGTGLPKIAVPLVAENREALQKALQEAEKSPADLIEYRADYDPEVMGGGAALIETLTFIRREIGSLPLLFTIRTAAEGGEADIPFSQYRDLNRQAAKSGLADMIDIELFTAAAGMGTEIRTFIAELQSEGVKIIGSSHDFEKTPEQKELVHRVKVMQEAGMDITKLAVMPQTREDVLRLLETALQIEEEIGDRPCVTMSMGAAGALSRICGSLTGSAITFGTAGTASAPGQIPAGELKSILSVLKTD